MVKWASSWLLPVAPDEEGNGKSLGELFAYRRADMAKVFLPTGNPGSTSKTGWTNLGELKAFKPL